MEIGTDVVTLSYFLGEDKNTLVTVGFYDSVAGKIVHAMSKSKALSSYGARVVKKVIAGYNCTHYDIC